MILAVSQKISDLMYHTVLNKIYIYINLNGLYPFVFVSRHKLSLVMNITVLDILDANGTENAVCWHGRFFFFFPHHECLQYIILDYSVSLRFTSNVLLSVFNISLHMFEY